MCWHRSTAETSEDQQRLLSQHEAQARIQCVGNFHPQPRLRASCSNPTADAAAQTAPPHFLKFLLHSGILASSKKRQHCCFTETFPEPVHIVYLHFVDQKRIRCPVFALGHRHSAFRLDMSAGFVVCVWNAELERLHAFRARLVGEAWLRLRHAPCFSRSAFL